MGDFFYRPGDAAIAAGETLTWRNVGKVPHTVKGPGFQSRQIDAGGTFENSFPKAGTFKYVCTFHPTLMSGTVKVAKAR